MFFFVFFLIFVCLCFFSFFFFSFHCFVFLHDLVVFFFVLQVSFSIQFLFLFFLFGFLRGIPILSLVTSALAWIITFTSAILSVEIYFNGFLFQTWLFSSLDSLVMVIIDSLWSWFTLPSLIKCSLSFYVELVVAVTVAVADLVMLLFSIFSVSAPLGILVKYFLHYVLVPLFLVQKIVLILKSFMLGPQVFGLLH